MDLGIAGRCAIVCGSSKGLGYACAEALAAEGVAVVMNGRDPARLEAAAAKVRATHAVEVRAVAADLSTPEGRQALLAACPEPDILINNSGGPPVVPLLEASEEQWLAAVNQLLLPALSLTRAVVPAMVARRFGRIVNITSAQVATPRSEMALSAGPRTALTAAMKGLALDLARHNVTVNNLLPERFATDRQRTLAEAAMKARGLTLEEALAERAQGIAARRMGDPQEFGATCAFVCSAHAGYMSGQNIHLDGGSYTGLI